MSQSTSSYGRVAGNIAIIPERIIKLGPQLSKVNSFTMFGAALSWNCFRAGRIKMATNF
jgi:hypothetical protein